MLFVKLAHTIDCSECNDLFRNKESTIDLDIEIKYLEYIDYLDRGVSFLQIYHS